MKLIINNFDKLSMEVQEEIQDAIAGYTPNFEIEDSFIECDGCGENNKETKPIDTDGGRIRLCFNCVSLKY